MPSFRPLCNYASAAGSWVNDPRNRLTEIIGETAHWCNQIRKCFNLPHSIKVYASPGIQNYYSISNKPNYGDEFILADPMLSTQILNNPFFGYFALVGILAHEVGHVKNRQRSSFPFPGYEEERRADFYAGYALRILNAPSHGLNNFLSVQQGFPGKYPPGFQRITFVQQGYNYIGPIP